MSLVNDYLDHVRKTRNFLDGNEDIMWLCGKLDAPTTPETGIPVSAPDDYTGHCSEGDRCVCGGDTPRVRAGCGNWVKGKSMPDRTAEALNHAIQGLAAIKNNFQGPTADYAQDALSRIKSLMEGK